MTKAFKLAIVSARHDDSFATISDAACREVMMTGSASVTTGRSQQAHVG